jgi:MarR family transcriptional regulator, transcriptional regulator for hemolysin
MTTAAPPAPLTSDLCWLLSRASHSLTTELTAALEKKGMSPRAHSVLATALTGEYTQGEVARMVGLDKTTMVITLDELEAAGLAVRRPSPGDRRVRVIAVTAAGKRKVREAESIMDEVREDVLSHLDAGDRETFLRALGSLACGRLSERVPCEHSVRRRG